PWSDRRRFAGEDQKGRLEGVLGVVMIADDTTADAEDHRPVATDKGCKRRFVLLLDEGRQQLPIRPACSIVPQHGPAKMPNHPVHLSHCHTCPLWPVASDHYPLLPDQSRFYALFSSAGRVEAIVLAPVDWRWR